MLPFYYSNNKWKETIYYFFNSYQKKLFSKSHLEKGIRNVKKNSNKKLKEIIEIYWKSRVIIFEK